MSHLRNLLANLPANVTEEVFETLLDAKDVRIERIVSRGQATPAGFWYDSPQNEWVLLLRGEARLEFEDSPPLRLLPGDCLTIPARQRHRVEWTSADEPTIWLAVHYG